MFHVYSGTIVQCASDQTQISGKYLYSPKPQAPGCSMFVQSLEEGMVATSSVSNYQTASVIILIL